VQLHHATLFVRDAEISTRFYRDGLGLEILMDREFEADWPALFGVTSGRLRAIILGDPANPQGGQVELVTFDEPVPVGPPAATPATGTVMLSFLIDLEVVLPRLEGLGGADLRTSTLSNGYRAATVRDPDGTLVQMISTVREARPS
jgi:catechol 2,3-dioxygenase-like lactoylglutathione lyase family enzyme